MVDADEIRFLIAQMACSLVDQTETVRVDAIEEHDGTLYRVTVAPGDVGKLIGKQGRTARAMRVILAGAAMKLKHRYALDIVQP
jgi:hypothetical protein